MEMPKPTPTLARSLLQDARRVQSLPATRESPTLGQEDAREEEQPSEVHLSRLECGNLTSKTFFIALTTPCCGGPWSARFAT